jgi:hypothetical protein
LKLITISAVAIMSIILLSSCAKKDNVYNGMYNMGNQMQQMKDPGPISSPGSEPLTYEQYKKERHELIKDETDLPQ